MVRKLKGEAPSQWTLRIQTSRRLTDDAPRHLEAMEARRKNEKDEKNDQLSPLVEIYIETR